MKKFFSILVLALSLAMFVGCNEKKDAAEQQTQQSTCSENYKKAEKCIRDYEQDIKAAKTCADLESATARFYEAQASVEVPDSTERVALKKLVQESQQLFLDKFQELDCASQVEEGEGE